MSINHLSGPNSHQPCLKDLNNALSVIPGTYVFDAQRARQGRALNAFCGALQTPQQRQSFKDDPASFLDAFDLTPAQREAVLSRDYNAMLELGGNIYFLSKIAAVDGHSFQQIAASMCGVSVEDFQNMMLSGGRAPQTTNRSNPSVQEVSRG